MRYNASFKLKVINFAKRMTNSCAAKEFGVNEKQVREWGKSEAMLNKMPKTKCANRGKTCKWPELEEATREWVNQQQANRLIVLRPTIRLQALKWAENIMS